MKHCSKCFEVLPMNKKYFCSDSQKKDGLKPSCKSCDKDYRKLNKGRIKTYQKAYKKKYYQENKEKISRYNKFYKAKNKEKVEELRKKNKEKYNARHREYLKENEAILKVKRREYRKKNMDKHRLNEQVRSARKRALKSTLTTNQWQQCLSHFKHQCAYCDCTEKLEQEHVIPVSKGGHYTADNIIPACRSCNASKNNKSLEEWYVNHQSYSTLRMDFIKDYLESNSLPILKEA